MSSITSTVTLLPTLIHICTEAVPKKRQCFNRSIYQENLRSHNGNKDFVVIYFDWRDLAAYLRRNQ